MYVYFISIGFLFFSKTHYYSIWSTDCWQFLLGHIEFSIILNKNFFHTFHKCKCFMKNLSKVEFSTKYSNSSLLTWLLVVFCHREHHLFFKIQWLIDKNATCYQIRTCWKKMLLKCSITMVSTCPLLSWHKMSGSFRENNNVIVFPFPFLIIMTLANKWIIRLQG